MTAAPDIVQPSNATPAAQAMYARGLDVCEAALRNFIALCQTNMGGRTHTTTVDLGFQRAVWSLAIKTFGPGNFDQEKGGDHLAHVHKDQAVPPELAEIMDRLALARP